MARKNGYVYYEADAVMSLTNPFIDIFVDNPTMAMFSSKALKVSNIWKLDITYTVFKSTVPW